MKNVLMILVAMLALACGDESDLNGSPDGNLANNAMADIGKGDSLGSDADPTQGAPQSEPESAPESETEVDIDLCAEFELYGDGECHTFCETPDSDCTEEELEAARDICEEEGRYGDGHCDEDCRYEDSDCDEPVDACVWEARYADGTCDTDCTYIDSDCDDYEVQSESELTEGEADICARYTGSSRVPIHDIAASLCLEREDARIVDCIAQCVEAFANR